MCGADNSKTRVVFCCIPQSSLVCFSQNDMWPPILLFVVFVALAHAQKHEERAIYSITSGITHEQRYARYKRSDGSFNFDLAKDEAHLTQAKYDASNRRVKDRLANGDLTSSAVAGVPSKVFRRHQKRALATVPLIDVYDSLRRLLSRRHLGLY